MSGLPEVVNEEQQMSAEDTAYPPSPPISNGAIANELIQLAQLLSIRGENPFKVKAYRRAARTLRMLGESIEEVVKSGGDLRAYPGIGPAISSVIEEIVRTGKLRQAERIRANIPFEILELTEYPLLDAKRVQRIYKKLNISSVAALKEKLASGEIAATLGGKMAQHVRHALMPSPEVLLYEADSIVPGLKDFLINKCGVRRAEAVGDYRRRVEVIREISFLVETKDFPSVLKKLERYGGKADVLEQADTEATLKLSTGMLLKITGTPRKNWGRALILSTGSEKHVAQLMQRSEAWRSERIGSLTEESNYRSLGLAFIPPELREGRDEVDLAAKGEIPALVSTEDIVGELHAHSTSSDGANTIEEMVDAARERGYQYIGISDHSQTLKIARGLPEEKLWEQIRFIDKLNERLVGIQVLKSAEVDILIDGSLDYSDSLLKELDYTVCSIHSRFGLGKIEQTERVLRAMENPYFNILGHATGRLLLKRPGYELDMELLVEQARTQGCFFEINSSPDRLDLSAENARIARQAGVKVAVTTDAHSVNEFRYLPNGIGQARRAGFRKESILNTYFWPELKQHFKR
jgi:DNA polymerase (family X)